METSYEGIWVLDSQFRVIQVNDRMAEMLGYSPQEIRGRKVTEFVHQDDLPDHEHHAAERLKGVQRPVRAAVSPEGRDLASYPGLSDTSLRYYRIRRIICHGHGYY